MLLVLLVAVAVWRSWWLLGIVVVLLELCVAGWCCLLAFGRCALFDVL